MLTSKLLAGSVKQQAIVLTEQVQMLTSKPLAGSMKQQANPYRTSQDVNKQAVSRVSEAAS